MTRFEKRVVIVTGAGSGIGSATVRRLFAEGASIVAVDVNKGAVERIAAEFDSGDRVVAIGADISDREQVFALVDEAVERFGVLYGLANCAGIRGIGSVLDTDPDAWDKVIAVNLKGTFTMCQAFARAMREASAHGAIMNLSSAAGIRGVPNRLPYAASKFGVIGISQTMALELGPLGIRVNAITPGMIRTPMTEPMFTDPANAARIRAAHPLGREGQPEEIASVIAFLLSEDASFMTGAVLVADGGKTAGIASH
jgi:meso-butanediol dehydrogenase / (S,S)-butanediol dehydrogenase / diacetyl reductase